MFYSQKALGILVLLVGTAALLHFPRQDAWFSRNAEKCGCDKNEQTQKTASPVQKQPECVDGNGVVNGWSTVSFYIGTEELPGSEWSSQVGQDQTIAQTFNFKKNGYFVDLAANDAVTISNTFALERNLGWSGICIEANPSYVWNLAKRRCKVAMAAVSHADDEAITFTLNGVGGGIVDNRTDNKPGAIGAQTTQNFRTVSLVSIFKHFKAPKIIDYFSLDVEGAEDFVMSGFPWKQYTFLTLTVERPSAALRQTLTANGYIYIRDHGNFGDKFYIHESLKTMDNVRI